VELASSDCIWLPSGPMWPFVTLPPSKTWSKKISTLTAQCSRGKRSFSLAHGTHLFDSGKKLHVWETAKRVNKAKPFQLLHQAKLKKHVCFIFQSTTIGHLYASAEAFQTCKINSSLWEGRA
jgi:hypothetical protein